VSNSLIVAVVIPLLLIQVGLIVWALVDLAKRERVKGGSKIVWVLVVVLFEFIGPILYLAWGREA
jgi:Phospholipase_D-nuclease N-terminal